MKRSYIRGAIQRACACVPAALLALSAGAVLAAEVPKPQDATHAAAAGAVAGNPKAFGDLLSTNCGKCHNSTDWAGSISFDVEDVGHPGGDPEVWEKVINRLSGRLMPPAGEKQPAQADVDSLLGYLRTSLDNSPKDKGVGHVPLQRLSRNEFAAEVKDLLGVDVDPKVLPTEIEVEGFSNIASAMAISPTFMEQYLGAARKVAVTAVGEPTPRMETFASGGGGGGGGQAGLGSMTQYTHREGYPLGTRGGISFKHVFPADGEYRFSFANADSIDAGLYPRGMETRATMVFLVDGKEVARREVGGAQDLELADRDGVQGGAKIIAEVSNVPAQIKAGEHTVTVTFIDRSWSESNDPTGGGKEMGQPIIRDGVTVQGPFQPHGLSLSNSRARIFVCEPKQASEDTACAQKIARHLAERAFRRPATDDDVQWLMKFYQNGRMNNASFDSGVTELVVATLSSPDFLYRAIQAPSAPGATRPLSDLELASRLSFFLWNAGPDDQLIKLAANHKLDDPAVVKAQVERMLRDPRAQSLVNDFAFSWLNLGTLAQVEPLDKAFNADMRQDFETEARLFLASVLLEPNRSVNDLLSADWTYVNDALARQYGIKGVLGPQFRRVHLDDQNRWGLLGKGAVQLRTSYADRTSPVLRGEYVLDRLLGTPPTPPPPNVNTDLSFHEGAKPTNVRQRLEAHRANPTCNGCHGVMDPYGLAMENFDVTGKWRTIDPTTKVPIDPTAALASGIVLRDPSDLRQYLMRLPDQFPTTVTKRLMMYALNREVEYYDMPQVRKIVADAAKNNYTFGALILGVVNSPSFREQGADVAPKGKAAPAKPASATTMNNVDVADKNVTAQNLREGK